MNPTTGLKSNDRPDTKHIRVYRSSFLSRSTIYTITIAFIIPPLFVVHFSRWLLDQCRSLEFNSLTATPVHVGIWFWCYAVHYWTIKLLYLVMYEHTTTWSQQKIILRHNLYSMMQIDIKKHQIIQSSDIYYIVSEYQKYFTECIQIVVSNYLLDTGITIGTWDFAINTFDFVYFSIFLQVPTILPKYDKYISPYTALNLYRNITFSCWAILRSLRLIDIDFCSRNIGSNNFFSTFKMSLFISKKIYVLWIVNLKN